MAWYRRYYEAEFPNMHDFTVEQIEQYTASALEQKVLWAMPESRVMVEAEVK